MEKELETKYKFLVDFSNNIFKVRRFKGNMDMERYGVRLLKPIDFPYRDGTYSTDRFMVIIPLNNTDTATKTLSVSHYSTDDLHNLSSTRLSIFIFPSDYSLKFIFVPDMKRQGIHLPNSNIPIYREELDIFNELANVEDKIIRRLRQ